MFHNSKLPFRLAFLALAVGLVGLAAVADEEEEVTPKKPPKKIVVDDDPVGPGAAGGTSIADLSRAAAGNDHVTIKKYYAACAVPHDRLTLKGGRSARISILPLTLPADKGTFPDPFGAAELDAQNKPAEEPLGIAVNQVLSLVPFEKFVLGESDKLLALKPTDLPGPRERLLAVERVLTQVLFFHESAVEQKKRRGANWEPIKLAISDKLGTVRVDLAREAATAKDWFRMKELIARFSVRYRTNPKLLQEFAAFRLLEAEELAQSKNIPELEAARDLLQDFESRFPNSGNPSLAKIRNGLSLRAKEFLDDARNQSDAAKARNSLRTVRALDPNQKELRDLELKLGGTGEALVIGVRRLPEFMSPATARFDSELWAVELLFEGLLETIPDDALGANYRPSLVTHKPAVSSLGRNVTLLGNAKWSRAGSGVFDAADLVGTIQLMHASRHNPSAIWADWLDEPELNSKNPLDVRVKLKQGHPDPRTVLAAKMLPAKWFLERKKSLDDAEFGRAPFGTGPYMLAPSYQPPVAGKVLPDVTFVANPDYASHAGRAIQPGIAEVKFLNLANYPDALNEVRGDRIHILPDVPTKELPKYDQQDRATVVTPAVNRRIHLLAINHRVPNLQDTNVRRALSAAIDRETILNDVYRAGQKQYHKALAGPFPSDCWAAARPLGSPAPSLFDRDTAAGKFRAGRNGALSFTLLYPDDDPQAADACVKIKQNIEYAGADSQASITLEAVAPRDLLRRVEKEHRYEIAYMTYDYRDDWYPLALAQFLDPTAASENGRNYTGYLEKSTNPSPDDSKYGKLLTDAKQTRDTDGKLKPLSHDLFIRFNEVVPFVPLWQIDRHMVVSAKLKVYFAGRPDPVPGRQLNATTLFNSVGNWKLDTGR